MVETKVEELLAAVGSLVVEVTLAVLVEVEAELKIFAVALMVIRTELPTLRLPRVQVTVGAA